MLKLYTGSIRITKQNKKKLPTHIQAIFSLVIDGQSHMDDIFKKLILPEADVLPGKANYKQIKFVQCSKKLRKIFYNVKC